MLLNKNKQSILCKITINWILIFGVQEIYPQAVVYDLIFIDRN